MSNVTQFWKTKNFDQMSQMEWESLCDGCGQCCLHKLQNADTGDVSYTNVACRLLDINRCRCKNYQQRTRLVPDCIVLKPELVDQFGWLPTTCAYRLIAEGKDLYDWHPLISGTHESVHKAKISISGKAISEREAGDLEDHIINIDELSNA